MVMVEETQLDRIENLLLSFINRVEDKFVEIDNRFEQIDKRFTGIEVRLGNIEERLDSMDDRFDRQDRKIGAVQDAVMQLNDKVDDIILGMKKLENRVFNLENVVFKNN